MRSDFLSHCIKHLRTFFVVATTQCSHQGFGEDIFTVSDLGRDGVATLLVLVGHLTLEVGQAQGTGLGWTHPPSAATVSASIT